MKRILVLGGNSTIASECVDIGVAEATLFSLLDAVVPLKSRVAELEEIRSSNWVDKRRL